MPDYVNSIESQQFRFKFYIWVLIAVWTILIITSLFINIRGVKVNIVEAAKIEGRTAIEKDVVYRRWNAGLGGVYAPVTDTTPPNPYLRDLPERDIETPSGKHLTLINPAYMTRQVHELMNSSMGIRGHITSLKPVRPENRADVWETAALRAFEGGAKEVSSVKMINGVEYLRLMKPLLTEKECLKCHGKMGYKEGDVRGGISVSVPMAPLLALTGTHIQMLSIAHFLIWLIGLSGIVIGKIKLEKSQHRYHDLYNNAPDMFLFANAESGEIIECNKTLMDSLGYLRKEIIGHRIYEFIHPDSAFRAREAFSRFLATGELHGMELQLCSKDGNIIDISMNTSAVRDSKGKLLYSRSILRDITERKKLESQLLHSQKMEAVGQLAGGIAHDFNNILSAIINYSYVLKKKSKEEETRNLIHEILSLSDKATEITQGLLAFSRKQPFELAPVHLNDAVMNALKLFLNFLGDDIQVTTTLNGSSLVIMADRVQLEQIMINLATNARDAMPCGGIFTIETAHVVLDTHFSHSHGFGRPGEYALLSVSDSGTGMNEGIREKIFEPFFTTKETGKGTGLGLAIIYGIVKQHDGYITVYSEPGVGTTFKIYFPVNSSGNAAVSKTDLRDFTGTGETVLIAENDGTVRLSEKNMLIDNGYSVIEAIDGEDAVRKFASHMHYIRLVIIDVVMPKKSGREAYEEIRKMNPEIRALFTSAYAQEVISSRGMVDKDMHFMTKPVMPGEFLRKIKEILASDPGHS